MKFKLENMKQKKRTQIITAQGQIMTHDDKGNKHDRLVPNINYSSILSRLIQEAAKKCKNYASDLFVSWQCLLADISKMDKPGTITEYFGFREMGVDHEIFIQIKMDSQETYGSDIYSSIFRLDVKTDESYVYMELIQIM